ncbi:helix-turn-helix domain-containing protein [Saccharothrix violaceirubra]|uniref:Transcriptional regulator with XRE-family HTH domain n=1 Tax=Saccharothrix violaceirubra TaxID=413306 RepID=A0A7W7TAT9_9PSEU|nr:helix-turn-helix transcriptional regulator [Saccharothrix violaceirubra]MBB4968400.1 transcriptional regulator with XRE-family HTH domain [Saccharothrix violaceirubra]
MADEGVIGIGDRMRAARRLAGLTQAQMARETNYSLSYVQKAERGSEPASPALVTAWARATKVSPDDLTGAPYKEVIQKDGPLDGLTDLQAILAEGRYVRAEEPLSLGELGRELTRINSLYRGDRGRQALALLPRLIRQLHGALEVARSDEARGDLYSLLASAYVTAERIARRFGYMQLSTPSLDRLDMYAERAGDPLFTSQALIKRARVLMYHGAYEVGLDLVERGLDRIEGSGEGSLAVRGYGHLAGAIVAARGRKIEVARAHLEEARVIAGHVRGESDAYGTLFGAGNVGIHAVAVELEAGDPGKAAEAGFALTLPAEIAPPRAGHHWQDTARACLMAGDSARALEALNRARRVAPQQTRLHPMVRETVRGIATMESRRSGNLANFATWLGSNSASM